MLRTYISNVDGNNIGDGMGSCGNNKDKNQVPTPIILQKMMLGRITPDGDAVAILGCDDAEGPLVEALSLNFKDGLLLSVFSSNFYNSGLYNTSYPTAPTTH